ncbi:MAG: hypothetical protein ACM3U2_12105, partial [Deltaproteobacteria bacterium]
REEPPDRLRWIRRAIRLRRRPAAAHDCIPSGKCPEGCQELLVMGAASAAGLSGGGRRARNRRRAMQNVCPGFVPLC